MTDRTDTGFLDGLRGLAALWVLTAHCMIWGAWYGLPLPNAKIAVDVFMLLSGFLMAMHARKREAREPFTAWRGWASFLIRRVMRLAPVYWLTLVLVWLLADSFLGGYSVLADHHPSLRASPTYHPRWIELDTTNLLAHASLMFGLLPRWSFATMLPDWSLSLEMQFYLALPLLYIAMQRLGVLRVAAALAGLSLAVASYLNTLPGPHGVVGLYPEPSMLLLKLPVFLAGMVLYASTVDTPRRRPACVALALACCLAQVWLYPSYGVGTVALVGAALLIAWLGHDAEGQAARIARATLDNRAMRFLADVSYPVYLLHGLVLAHLGGWLFQRADFMGLAAAQRVWWLWLGVTAGTYAAAWAVHRLVERPGIALGRRMARTITRPMGDSGVEPATSSSNLK